MSTYLELCREAAQLSGTIDRRTIAVVGAPGRLGLLADLMRSAWEEIQNQYRAWRFLTVDIPDTTRLGTGISAFEPNSLNLEHWAEWIPGTDEDTVPITIWPAPGMEETGDPHRAQEISLSWEEYRVFRQLYQTGSSLSTPAATPRAFSVDNRDRLVVWPRPDRDYRIAGTYRRAAQRLSGNDDVPIIAQEHQDVIVWAAVLLLHRHDEAESNVLVTTQQGLDTRLAALRRRYLRPTTLAFSPLGATPPGSVRPLSPRAPT